MDNNAIHQIAETFATAITTGGTVAGILFACLKKWFLDTETYYKQRKEDREMRESEENKIIDKFDELIARLDREKANAEDLVKTERKIEKLDERVNAVTQTTERVCIKLDMYIDAQKDMQSDIKEINESLKGLTVTVASLDTKVESLTTKFEGGNNG